MAFPIPRAAPFRKPKPPPCLAPLYGSVKTPEMASWAKRAPRSAFRAGKDSSRDAQGREKTHCVSVVESPGRFGDSIAEIVDLADGASLTSPEMGKIAEPLSCGRHDVAQAEGDCRDGRYSALLRVDENLSKAFERLNQPEKRSEKAKH